MNIRLTLAMATATASLTATACHAVAPTAPVALNVPTTGPHVVWLRP